MLPSLNSAYMNEAMIAEQKWDGEGLLAGLPRNTKREKDVRLATAMMLENQYLANEQASPAATSSDDIAQFRRITIPMLRRFFPQLVAHHLVGVQPLIGPSGYVYYMRFRAGIEKGNQEGVIGIDATTRDIKYPTAGYDNASLQQTTDGIPVVPVYYSHQRNNYENSYTTSQRISSAGSYNTYTFTVARTPVKQDSCLASAADVAQNPTLTAGNKYTIWGVVYDSDVAIQYFNITGTSTVTFQDIGSPSPKMTALSITLSSGILAETWNGDPGAHSLRYYTYEYDMECQTALPRINLVVESDLVESKTRKLRADWSLEAQQDLRNQHNLDVESELTSFLAEEVNLEIDREIVSDLRDNAGTVAVWDYATALGETIKEKYESLYVKVVEVSNQIHKKTLRSHANWIVASPEICAIFETATAGFAPSPSQGFESNIGIQYVGTVNGRYRLFKDPAAPQAQMVMGYRGESMLDVGYYYCPYVALQQSPLLYDPESWCPRKGVLTRYGKILLREGSRFFARVNLVNFFI